MDWSTSLGLAKEVPVEGYLQGVQLREMQTKRALAKEAERQQRQQKLSELVSYKKGNIHNALYKDYTEKINGVLSPLLEKQRLGTLTDYDVSAGKSMIEQLQEQYESQSKNLTNFQQQNPENLSVSGRWFQNQLRSNVSLSDIKANSPYEQNAGIRLFNPDTNELDLTNTYVRYPNVYQGIYKDVATLVPLSRKTAVGWTVTTKGWARNREDLKNAELNGWGDVGGNYVTQEEAFAQYANNPEYLQSAMRTMPDEWMAERKKVTDNLVNQELINMGVKGVQPNSPQYNEIKKKIEESPEYQGLIDKQTFINLGVKQPFKMEYEQNKDRPIRGVGGNKKESESTFYASAFNNINYKKIISDANTKGLPVQTILTNYTNPFGATMPSNIEERAKKEPNNHLNMYIPITQKERDKKWSFTATPTTRVSYTKDVNGKGRFTIGKLSDILTQDEINELGQFDTTLGDNGQQLNLIDEKGRIYTFGKVVNDKASLKNARPMITRYYTIETPKGGIGGGESNNKSNMVLQIGGGGNAKRDAVLRKLAQKGVRIVDSRTGDMDLSDWGYERDTQKTYELNKQREYGSYDWEDEL